VRRVVLRLPKQDEGEQTSGRRPPMTNGFDDVHVRFAIGLGRDKYQRGSITARSSTFALSQRPDVIDKGEYSDTHDRLDDFP
jgi:hypothetical protein